jgi:hypothetical protein
VLAALLLSLPCQPTDGYAKADATGWTHLETQVVGNCSFTLDGTYLRHVEGWEAGLAVTTKNVGPENTHCAWEAVIISGDGRAVSNRDGFASSLGADSEHADYIDFSESFTAGADQQSAWIHVSMGEGALGRENEAYWIVSPRDSPPDLTLRGN